MERTTIMRTGQLMAAATALALGACTSPGKPEAELPDSAMLEVPADPVAAPQPTQAESVGRAPTSSPSRSATPNPPATTTPARPPLRQPPDARDIRPSIPFPPDTL